MEIMSLNINAMENYTFRTNLSKSVAMGSNAETMLL